MAWALLMMELLAPLTMMLIGETFGAVMLATVEPRFRAAPEGRATGLIVGTTGAVAGEVLMGTALLSFSSVGALAPVDGGVDVPDEVAVPTVPGDVWACAASGNSVPTKKIKAATAANRRRKSKARFFMDLLTEISGKTSGPPWNQPNPNACNPLNP